MGSNIIRFQFSSVAQSCPTLCDPMNRSTPGLTVHQQLPKFTQTHVHRVGDAIQPYHPLSPPSPPALTLSQHQGLFRWVSSSHQVAKVLEFYKWENRSLKMFGHIAKDYIDGKWQIWDRTDSQVWQTPAPTAIMLHWVECLFGYRPKRTFIWVRDWNFSLTICLSGRENV